MLHVCCLVCWQQSGAVLIGDSRGVADAEALSIVWSSGSAHGSAWRRLVRALPRSVDGEWLDSAAPGGSATIRLRTLADRSRLHASAAHMAWREADGTVAVLPVANGVDGPQALVRMFGIEGTLQYEAEQQQIKWSNGAVWVRTHARAHAHARTRSHALARTHKHTHSHTGQGERGGRGSLGRDGHAGD
jgi:hypothetical protein